MTTVELPPLEDEQLQQLAKTLAHVLVAKALASTAEISDSDHPGGNPDDEVAPSAA